MARAFAHLSDEAVVALVSRSDESALAELYDRFGRVAYGLALRVLRDSALAEDAVQEAFLAAWRSADRPGRGVAGVANLRDVRTFLGQAPAAAPVVQGSAGA